MGERGSLIIRTLIFTVLVPGSITVLVPRALLQSDLEYSLALDGFRFVGVVFMAAGILIYLWCASDFIISGRGTPNPFDAPKQLVVRGLYHFTRNPMYVGVGSIVVGEGLLFESATLLAFVTVLMLLFHIRVVTYEEPTLRRLFGAAFDSYCARVPRWLPNASRRDRPWWQLL